MIIFLEKNILEAFSNFNICIKLHSSVLKFHGFIIFVSHSIFENL
ncbi:MAG: hypothetical protein WCG25_02995 [bacterium]